MMKLIVIFTFLLLLHNVYADSVKIVFNGKAIHEEKKNFNENNGGLGFEYDFEEKDHWINFVNGGFFKDSNSNNSNYLGVGLKRRFKFSEGENALHFDAGFTAFMMTRKDFKNNQPFFGALPYFSLGTNKFAINATYIPSVSPKLVSLWFFQATLTVATW
ncbi:MAG: hypothetical protein QM484_12425 [Woeseiaceae bacterium]